MIFFVDKCLCEKISLCYFYKQILMNAKANLARMVVLALTNLIHSDVPAVLDSMELFAKQVGSLSFCLKFRMIVS